MSVETTLPPSGWQQRLRRLLNLPVQLLRDFVWVDVRAGLVDVRGLDTPTRFLVVVGFALLVGTVLALLFNEPWREQSTLVPQLSGVVGRGTLVPSALLPVTFFLIAVAWAYGLAGALHSHWAVRIAVNTLYVLFALGWLNTTGTIAQLAAPTTLGPNDYIELGILVGAVIAVPILFVVRARRVSRPAWDWLALFVFAAAFFALIQARGIANWREFEIPVIVGVLQTNLASYQGLVMPLLLLAGVNIALFANQAARWTTEMAEGRMSLGLLATVLVLALGLRIWTVVNEAAARVNEMGMGSEVWALGGAVGVIVISVAAYFGVIRLSKSNTFAIDMLVARVRGVAFALILIKGALTLVEFVVINVVQATPSLRAWDPVRASLFGVTDFLQGQLLEPWLILVYVLTLGAAVWLARRGLREVALYLAITAGLALWYNLTAPDGWLGALRGASAARIDFFAMLILAALALYWAAQKALTRERMAGLFFLTLLTGLVRQTDFISSPFSPFLGFAGIGFVAFGILYDAVTAGAWANAESKAFPRIGRIFLYLGYVLLSVMIVNWALASHDLNNIEALTGSVAWRGMELFGLPFLYAVAVVTVARLMTDDDGRVMN